tara:strand:- start:7049 stop:7426 length:378 start_codon:yes stop_codon:yes gene_type:complete
MSGVSLSEIAHRARFANIHDRGSQHLHLMGSVRSNKFESLYVRFKDKRTVEVFGIMDQRDYEPCALFEIEGEYVEKYMGGNGECNPGAGGINLDDVNPTSEGEVAVELLRDYAIKLEDNSEFTKK